MPNSNRYRITVDIPKDGRAYENLQRVAREKAIFLSVVVETALKYLPLIEQEAWPEPPTIEEVRARQHQHEGHNGRVDGLGNPIHGQLRRNT